MVHEEADKMVEEVAIVKKIIKSCLLCSDLARRMGRGFGLDMYIVEVANEDVVKLVEEVAKVALVILVSLVNLVLVKFGINERLGSCIVLLFV